MDRSSEYQALVNLRKKCRACEVLDYKNQSVLNDRDGRNFDTEEIGNLTTWANDLNADLMVVAQDFSNQEIYLRDLAVLNRGPCLKVLHGSAIPWPPTSTCVNSLR